MRAECVHVCVFLDYSAVGVAVHLAAPPAWLSAESWVQSVESGCATLSVVESGCATLSVVASGLHEQPAVEAIPMEILARWVSDFRNEI